MIPRHRPRPYARPRLTFEVVVVMLGVAGFWGCTALAFVWAAP